MKIRPSFTCPHVTPNLNGFPSSSKWKSMEYKTPTAKVIQAWNDMMVGSNWELKFLGELIFLTSKTWELQRLGYVLFNPLWINLNRFQRGLLMTKMSVSKNYYISTFFNFSDIDFFTRISLAHSIHSIRSWTKQICKKICFLSPPLSPSISLPPAVRKWLSIISDNVKHSHPTAF